MVNCMYMAKQLLKNPLCLQLNINFAFLGGEGGIFCYPVVLSFLCSVLDERTTGSG